MTNRVRWEEVGPELFEDMCAVLVSRLYPDSRRIDGTGGDGGRDVQVPTSAGPIVFEMKSFTGRLTPARRKQVNASLRRAAKHEPTSWRLVVPIDPTPQEEVWFEALPVSLGLSFECQWLGKTWLDSQMSKFPDIRRYFLGDANKEVVDVLRELQKESAALSGGVPDALERINKLTQRLNELDPHYAFGTSTNKDGSSQVTVWPKYAGAERDRPIIFNATLRFPQHRRGREAARAFQESLDFGSASTIPAEYVRKLSVDAPAGLGATYESADIQLGPPESIPVHEFSMVLRIIDESGLVKAQLPLRGRPVSRGRRGGDVDITDPLGVVSGRLRLDDLSKTMHMTFSYSMPKNVLPSAMIPALQFMAEYRSPNSAVILIEGVQAGHTLKITEALNADIQPALEVARALAEIQSKTGVYFPFPDEITDAELQSIYMAWRLLSGDTVTQRWSDATVTSTVAGLRSLKSGPNDLIIESEMSIAVAGQEIPIGRVRRSMVSAIVADPLVLPEDAPDEQPIKIRFVPSRRDNFITSVLSAPVSTTAA